MNPPDPRQLLQVLQHGYRYEVMDGESVRQELVAPNAYMRIAANQLVHAWEQLDRSNAIVNQLMQEREQLIRYQEVLNAQLQSLQRTNATTNHS